MYPFLLSVFTGVLLLIHAACADAWADVTASAAPPAAETAAAPSPSDTTWRAGDRVEIAWSGGWYPGRVTAVRGAEYRIRYDGYDQSWDEWVDATRLRRPRTAEAAPDRPTAAPTPAPAAAPAPAATGRTGAALRPGRYGCYFNNHPHGLGRSSIQYVEVLSGTRYREPRGSGSWSFDRATGVIRVSSGPLQGRVGHLRAEAGGNPQLVFERRENEVNGRPTMDISATHCYFGQD